MFLLEPISLFRPNILAIFPSFQYLANELPLSQSVSVMRIEVNGFSLATH